MHRRQKRDDAREHAQQQRQQTADQQYAEHDCSAAHTDFHVKRQCQGKTCGKAGPTNAHQHKGSPQMGAHPAAQGLLHQRHMNQEGKRTGADGEAKQQGRHQPQQHQHGNKQREQGQAE